jgi:hypothetical protein
VLPYGAFFPFSWHRADLCCDYYFHDGARGLANQDWTSLFGGHGFDWRYAFSFHLFHSQSEGITRQWEWNRDTVQERTNFEAALERALGRDELYGWLQLMERTEGWSRELQDMLDANKVKAMNETELEA